MDWARWGFLVIAYLIGGIPVGVLVARAKGVDLFAVGSGNIGTTNVVRALGLKYGILVWIGDVAKGVVGALIPRLAGASETWVCAAGAAAVMGHCVSPYLRFRGGRGIATSLGVLLVAQWTVGLIAFGLWIGVMLASRIVSLASLVAAASLMPLGEAFHASLPFVVLSAFLTCNGFIRHRPNLERLLRGEEHRFGRSRDEPARPEGEG
jgi:glycerol-3-phosphate acyltransferase PlsY